MRTVGSQKKNQMEGGSDAYIAPCEITLLTYLLTYSLLSLIGEPDRHRKKMVLVHICALEIAS